MSTSRKRSKQDLPKSRNPETLKLDTAGKKGLITLRAAFILEFSLVLAVTAGALTYLSGPQHAYGIPVAALAAAAAVFVTAVKLLDAIIAD